MACEPFWESQFLAGSYGYRPERGSWDMLARLVNQIVEQDRWVLAVDDIRDAFDHVVIDQLLEDHAAHGFDVALIKLIESHYGRPENGSPAGIDQGAPFSPLALNGRLHCLHDSVVDRTEGHPLWLRYCDNLTYLVRSVQEGKDTLDLVENILQEGSLTLKGELDPTDIREQPVQVLGLDVTGGENQVSLGLADRTWENLESSLLEAHEEENPPQRAKDSLVGWVQSYGPAFPDLAELGPDRIPSILDKTGFPRLLRLDTILQEGKKAYRSWLGRLKADTLRN